MQLKYLIYSNTIFNFAFMLNLGKKNSLTVVREVDFGFYLSDLVSSDVLLPRKWASEGLAIDDEIEVFIYLDHEERPIATTMEPKIYLNQFAYLRAKMITQVGAFMDWGLEKDLFVPFKNQPKPFEEGKWYLIYLYLDTETDRLVGTARNNSFLNQFMPHYEVGASVEVVVCEDTDIGKNAIVDHLFSGIFYHSDIFKPIKRGEKCQAYIKKVREDGKIDLSLEPIGKIRFEQNAEKILAFLKRNGGATHLTDKSTPEDVYELLQMSKKNFKAALGTLYKAHKISLEKNQTRLL
jgi:uncharacterized protein